MIDTRIYKKTICTPRQPVHEAKINGEWMHYDGMSAGTFDQAKDFYSHWHYIGSGSITRHNGNEFDHEQECHFFSRDKFSKIFGVKP